MSSSQRITVEEMRDHQVTDCEEILQRDDNFMRSTSSISTKPPLQQDWILLAAAIDRVLFILYFFLFSILALVYAI